MTCWHCGKALVVYASDRLCDDCRIPNLEQKAASIRAVAESIVRVAKARAELVASGEALSVAIRSGAPTEALLERWELALLTVQREWSDA